MFQWLSLKDEAEKWLLYLLQILLNLQQHQLIYTLFPKYHFNVFINQFVNLESLLLKKLSLCPIIFKLIRSTQEQTPNPSFVIEIVSFSTVPEITTEISFLFLTFDWQFLLLFIWMISKYFEAILVIITVTHQNMFNFNEQFFIV